MTRLGTAVLEALVLMGPVLVLLGALWVGDVLANRAARREERKWR